MNLGIEGKVAIITGGASGIGAALVRGFVNEKAKVIIADIHDASNILKELDEANA